MIGQTNEQIDKQRLIYIKFSSLFSYSNSETPGPASHFYFVTLETHVNVLIARF